MDTFPNDPRFDPIAVETRVQSLWMQLQLCRMNRDLEPMKPYFSEDLYVKEEAALRQDIQANRMRFPGQPAILNGSISVLSAERGRETVLCSLFTRFSPETRKWDSRKRETAKGETFYREEWTLTRPEGTKTPVPGEKVDLHCPGCGAPLSLYRSAKCPMCGTLNKVPDFTWTVEKIAVTREDNP